MKKAPCVRFASLIKPKMSENPEESRKSRPPSDRLLRPWMIQNCICHVGAAGVIAGIVLELLAECRREHLIERIVELGRIPASSQNTEGFVAQVAQHGFVQRRHAADHSHLVFQPVFNELTKE